jgi:FKBP-type peptidyl-prolyl cis-trans isomerase SlyD
MQIEDECVAYFHYTLTNDKGEVIDSSVGGQPLPYLHGAGNIVSGLEREMAGKTVGAKFSVRVSPEDGYGVHHPQLIQQVPREVFGGIDQLEVGMQFNAQAGGGMMPVVISAIDGDQVTIDGNHPLAGQHLNFAVEVMQVRKASAEELAHGHVHGPGGHH